MLGVGVKGSDRWWVWEVGWVDCFGSRIDLSCLGDGVVRILIVKLKEKVW